MKFNKMFFLVILIFGAILQLSGMENDLGLVSNFGQEMQAAMEQTKEEIEFSYEKSKNLFNLLKENGTKVSDNRYKYVVPIKGIFGFYWQKFVLTATEVNYNSRGVKYQAYNIKSDYIYYPQTKLLMFLGTVGIPVSLYAYAKNYTWVNNQFWNLFKR